jgi:hypothetical protein
VKPRPTTPWHETIVPPAYKLLPPPADFGRWGQVTADARKRLNEYETRRADGAPLEPDLERMLERRLRRRERDGRLGPPPDL